MTPRLKERKVSKIFSCIFVLEHFNIPILIFLGGLDSWASAGKVSEWSMVSLDESRARYRYVSPFKDDE